MEPQIGDIWKYGNMESESYLVLKVYHERDAEYAHLYCIASGKEYDNYPAFRFKNAEQLWKLVSRLNHEH